MDMRLFHSPRAAGAIRPAAPPQPPADRVPARPGIRWLAAAALGLSVAAGGAVAQQGPDAAADSLSHGTAADLDAGAGWGADWSSDDTAGLIEAPDGAALLSGADAAAIPLMGEPPLDGGWPGVAGFLAPQASAPAAAARQAAAPPAPTTLVDLQAAPVVVELFTAQGCSSCPPADRLLASLAGRPDVLPLAWHVDYWDYLGWADAFARPENTARQEGYARVVGERGVYTPQMVVDGQDTLLATRPADLIALIEDHRARPAAIIVTAAADGGRHVIQLTPRAAIPGGVRVVLVRYAPQREVTVKAGENRGKTILYANVVLGSEELTHWDAQTPLRLTVSPGTGTGEAPGSYPPDTRHAILAQQGVPGKAELPGPILAAVRLD
ncbi:thioredoxin family protein [Paracoccus sp. Z118]|uniref:DUF1223 domain-containing protein n=1 Tax=Paracoccus sp. Z118 TaxID=2851017 RepID=UPI0020B794F9|nr:DUF1223 domain-containing protein [Paracoccus sp. Z118]